MIDDGLLVALYGHKQSNSIKTDGMMKKNCKNMQEFEKYFLTCARFLELAKNIYDYKQQKTAADGGTVC